MILRLRSLSIVSKRFAEIEQLRVLGIDNSLKVEFALQVLNKHGRIFEVYPPPKRSMRMKEQFCYSNAVSKRSKGYGYVEGVITSKKTGFEISHAWNVDADGRHVDFTIMETDQYTYLGVVIPWPLVSEVAFSTKPMWYTTLPYLTYSR
jgi:hypothetical protein